MSVKPYVIEALRDFRQKHVEKGDKITPQLLIDDVRDNPGHPLYEEFTWEDDVAAEAYRIDQAKSLLRVKVEIIIRPLTTIRVPFMVLDRRPDRAGRSEYVLTSEVVSDPEASRLTMIAELQQIRNKVFRAEQISAGTQFSEITTALSAILRRVDELMQEVESIDPIPVPPQKKGGSAKRK